MSATATTFSFGAPRMAFGPGAAAELAEHLTALAPTRLAEIGFGADDVDALVAGALEQQRLVGSLVEVGAAELETVIREWL